MNLTSSETDLLKKIYSLYHKAVDKEDRVCKEKCASCCTCNVTLTSLEMLFILTNLNLQEKQEFQNRVQQRFPENRFIPKMTTNGFARMCMENQDVPEEENDPAFGVCPLLEHALCTIYEARPFGCRALMSQVLCNKEGYAKVPPLVLTLNTLFLQVIEHLDQKGFSGNLSDMAAFFVSDKKCTKRADKPMDVIRKRLFVSNEKIPVLMVPPEHRQELKPLIRELSVFLNG